MLFIMVEMVDNIVYIYTYFCFSIFTYNNVFPTFSSPFFYRLGKERERERERERGRENTDPPINKLKYHCCIFHH